MRKSELPDNGKHDPLEKARFDLGLVAEMLREYLPHLG
jgi:hypothetical protein